MASKKEKAAAMLVCTNLSQRDIANKLDMREETLSRWKKDEGFKKLIKKNEQQYMKDLVSPALRGLKDLVEAQSEFVKLEAIKTILDRAGYETIDDRLHELEIEHTRARIDKTKAEINKIKGVSEEIEDMSDIEEEIYGVLDDKA
ncbi:phBC6A51 family helix-turn-helix protein [Anaerococcus nagyae]|uniref:phBC6A51 family helix-turn-helix protein n=1 Tax=Anaerococcus nagyae TaxID=1755241 RepID=UPI003255565C